MNIPQNLKYTKSHEWLEEISENQVKIGLTDYAQDQLGDLVFVNLPAEGDEISAGETFGDVESVKAVSDLYSPVSGTVSAINEDLLDAPESINEDAYGAWLIEASDVTNFEELLTAEEYETYCQSL